MEKANHIRQLPLKVLSLSFIFFGIVFVLILTLVILKLLPFSWAWGWLLGAFVGSLNYGLIIMQANRLTLSIQHGIKPNTGPGYMFLRLTIFGLGLIASVLVKIDNQELFNVFSVFLAYLVISSTIFITGANFKAKGKVIK